METISECETTPGTYVVKANLSGEELDAVILRRVQGGYIKIR